MIDASDLGRTANLLGALSIAVAERLYASVGTTTGRPRTDTAALVILSTTLDGTSQETLASVLSLTQSGAVRLVDRLAAAGLVDRRDGPDGRTRAVVLTREGHATARRALREREMVTLDLMQALDADQQEALTPLLETLLGHLTTTRAEAPRICRLCDPVSCGHHTGRCPVTLAAAALAPA